MQSQMKRILAGTHSGSFGTAKLGLPASGGWRLAAGCEELGNLHKRAEAVRRERRREMEEGKEKRGSQTAAGLFAPPPDARNEVDK